MIINKVKIENAEYNYDINENVVKLANDDLNVEILRRFNNDYYDLLVNGKKIIVGIKKESNQLQLNYKNRLYEVELIDSFSALQKELSHMSGTDSNKTIVKAPMPGLVMKINKNLNDKIEKGDTILIIEAMKMENAIKSPVSGTLSAIRVSLSNSVAKNDVLFEIEKSNI